MNPRIAQGLIGLKDQKKRAQIGFMGRGKITGSRDRDPIDISSKTTVMHMVHLDINNRLS